MPESLLAVEQRQQSASGNLSRRWAGYIGLTTAVGLAYFLIAELGLGLSDKLISCPCSGPDLAFPQVF